MTAVADAVTAELTKVDPQAGDYITQITASATETVSAQSATAAIRVADLLP